MKVLVIEPEKAPYEKEIESGLESLQAEVGGYIEGVYPFDEPVAIVCNEEGKLQGLRMNRVLRDAEGTPFDIVFGTFLIVGLDDENGRFTGLSDELMAKFKEKFACPEMFIIANGELHVFPFVEEEEK